MRLLSLLLFVLIAAACGGSRKEPPSPVRFLKLEPGKVEKTMGCYVVLDAALDNHIVVRHACRVPIVEISEGRWWGNRPEPKGITMKVGDCLLLELFYYCLEEIEPGKSVSFYAEYHTAESISHDILKRHRTGRDGSRQQM
jgi:hypothetical protein